MKNNYPRVLASSLRTLILFVVVCLLSANVYSQTAEEKKALKIAQTSAALEKAKLNIVKAERKISVSDSLTDIGIQQQIEGKDELKKLEVDLKAYEKEYYATEKAIYKRIDSKDEVEALKAESELKEIEAKYKANLKENDVKAKAALKKTAKGDADENKGKTQKKPAEEGLLKAQAALEVAQAKYNMASGTEIVKVAKSKKITETKVDSKKKKKDLEKEKDSESEKVKNVEPETIKDIEPEKDSELEKVKETENK